MSQPERLIDLLRESIRLSRLGSTRPEPVVCAFCFERIADDVRPVIIAFRNVHPACAKEFDAWVSMRPEEWDARWNTVTDNTLVEFDGQPVAWGELSVYERKTVRMQSDGRLVGGYGDPDSCKGARFEITALGRAAIHWTDDDVTPRRLSDV